MNCENFDFFWKASKHFAKLRIVRPDLIDSKLGGIKINGNQFDEALAETLSKAKIFEIEDSLKQLLALTDTPKVNEGIVRLPFEDVFFDVKFTRKELESYGITPKYASELRGISITKGNFVVQMKDFQENPNHVGEKVGSGLKITICSIWEENKEIIFDAFNKNVNLDREYKNEKFTVIDNPTSDINLRDFVHKFILNFLNFLNNPEVTYTEHKRNEGNIRRKIKLGKAIISSSVSILITGKLRIYLDNVRTKELWHYGYRFWVRGHFRDLVADKWNEKKRIWIYPYIKGEGILIEKAYKLELNKQ